MKGQALKDADAIFRDIEQNFFSQVQTTDKVFPYEVLCVSYDTVPFVGRPSAIDYKLTAEAMDALFELRAIDKRKVSDIQYILVHKEQFDCKNASDSALEDLKSICLKRMECFEKEIRKLAADVTYTPNYVPTYQLPNVEMPPRLIGGGSTETIPHTGLVASPFLFKHVGNMVPMQRAKIMPLR